LYFESIMQVQGVHHLERLQAERLRFLLRSFPAVLLVGPRQCGKSTLARHALPNWTHLDLERPADLAVLAADLEGFFDAHPRSVVIDEAERLPEVFSILHHVIDRSRGKGRFLLPGSAKPALMRSVSETLAGRVALLELTARASDLAQARRLFRGPGHRGACGTRRASVGSARVFLLADTGRAAPA
jgi:predicted AAA+ superfamily ATPase